MRHPQYHVCLIAWVLGVWLCIGGCVLNPITGTRSMVLIPDEIMNDLGRQSYIDVKRQLTPSRDRRSNDVVNRITQKIAQASGASFDWEVTLAQSAEKNAFVLPGGKIVVYTGIMEVAENEAALAFIMGHEVGHAIARHGAQRLSQSLLTEVALATLAETTLRDHPERELILAGIGLGTQVGVMLPFSRKHESEADLMGLVYMARAGYDPREAPKFWLRMSRGSQGVPEFLSTHPSGRRRAQDLQNQLASVMKIYEQNPHKVGLGQRF